MYGVYMMGSLLGYFSVMILFMILAIVFAKRVAGWVLYGIGAGIQLLSLLGMAKRVYISSQMTPYWIAYIVLLIITYLVIIGRRA